MKTKFSTCASRAHLMHHIRIVMVFGFLLAGFFLLVSHINQMDPAIGQMMPVLNSPLLSIHVSIIMMSYALLSLTFICGIMGICMQSHAEELQTLSRIFLYPTLPLLPWDSAFSSELFGRM